MLKEKLEEAETEKTEMIENFRVSSSVLLERIKELESVNLGARPQTANILKRIGFHLIPELINLYLGNRFRNGGEGSVIRE